MIEGLPGGFPVQRRQHGDVIDGPGEQLGQRVNEVIAQIDLQALAGFQCRKDRARFWGPASSLPICNQFLRPNGERAQSILYAEMVIMPRSVRRS